MIGDNKDNLVLRRRGRPKKYLLNNKSVDIKICKPFKLLKMHVLDKNKNNPTPWWIAEFDEPVDFKTLISSLMNWKLLHVDNYNAELDKSLTISRSRGRPRGCVTKRKISDECIGLLNNANEDSLDDDETQEECL